MIKMMESVKDILFNSKQSMNEQNAKCRQPEHRIFNNLTAKQFDEII